MAQATTNKGLNGPGHVAAHAPRMAVVQAYDSLLILLGRWAARACRQEDVQNALSDSRPMLALARLLVRVGELPASGEDLLYHLQTIRNLAVQGSKVSPEQALQVVDMAEVARELIESLMRISSSVE